MPGYQTIMFEKLVSTILTQDIYLIGRPASPWGGRFLTPVIPDIGDPPSGLNRQFGYAQWIIPDENDPPAATRFLVFHWGTGANDEISLDIRDVGGKATLRARVYDAGATYGDYDISALYTQGDPIFTYLQFDGYGADNAARLKLWVNGAWVTLSFTGTIPPGPLDLGTTVQGTVGWGNNGAATADWLGWMGQIRFFHGDRVAQDNPGLPSAATLLALHNGGAGEPASQQGVSGFNSLLAEYLFTDQANPAEDTSGNGYDATVSTSNVGYGGTQSLSGGAEAWAKANPSDFDFGSVQLDTESSALDIRLRNLGPLARTDVGLYLVAGDSDQQRTDLQNILDAGDAGYGIQLQQKNGAGDNDWGAWASITNASGGDADNLVTLSRFGVDPVQTTDGDLPVGKGCRFRVRMKAPPASARLNRFKPRLVCKYAA